MRLKVMAAAVDTLRVFLPDKNKPELSEDQLYRLRLSLNTPVVETEDLPEGPARAALLVHYDPDVEGVTTTVGIRSLTDGTVVYYRYQAEISDNQPFEAALDAGLAFTEPMGFLFDDEEIHEVDTRDQTRALQLFWELMGEFSAEAETDDAENLVLDLGAEGAVIQTSPRPALLFDDDLDADSAAITAEELLPVAALEGEPAPGAMLDDATLEEPLHFLETGPALLAEELPQVLEDDSELAAALEEEAAETALLIEDDATGPVSLFSESIEAESDEIIDAIAFPEPEELPEAIAVPEREEVPEAILEPEFQDTPEAVLEPELQETPEILEPEFDEISEAVLEQEFQETLAEQDFDEISGAVEEPSLPAVASPPLAPTAVEMLASAEPDEPPDLPFQSLTKFRAVETPELDKTAQLPPADSPVPQDPSAPEAPVPPAATPMFGRRADDPQPQALGRLRLVKRRTQLPTDAPQKTSNPVARLLGSY